MGGKIFNTFIIILAMSCAFTPEALIRRAEAAVTSSDAELRFGAARRSLRLQTEKPSGAEPMKAQLPEPNRWDWFKVSRETWVFIADLAKILIYASAAVIIAVVLFNVKNNLWSSSHSRKLQFGRSEAGGTRAAERMETAQAEADDLARAGSFAEAMHVMLLQSVAEMRRRLKSPIAASLTSRELLSRLDLSPEERNAFATIVGGVEISHFGSHQPGGDEYEVFRRDFDALTELLRRERA